MRALAIAVVFASSVAAVLNAQTPATPPAAAVPPAAKPPAPPPPQKPAMPAMQPPAAAPATPPPAGPAQPQAPQTPGAPAQPPKPVGAYTYEAENRRDPFVTLLGTGPETVAKKGEGPAGMLIAEISVRGIMQSKGAYVAMVEGPDKKTYIVHTGDRFADGAIKSIMPTGLVIIQEVNDPLSLVKQREVRKLLRSLEDAKE